MPLPITIPYTFGTSTSSIPLSELDSNFSTISTAVNGIGSGTFALSNPVLGLANATSISATTSLLSSGNGGVGYNAGAGGSVSQATNKTTAVTINKICGQITMSAGSLSSNAEATFTVNNSTVSSTDVIIVNHASVGTSGAYVVMISNVSSGSFNITVSNISGSSKNEAIVLNFAVIKSVTA
jgi:hypothetical protein